MEHVLGANKPTISVKVGNTSYKLIKPKLGFQNSVQEKLHSEEGKANPFPILMEWAVHVGLPKEVVENELDTDDLHELFELLSVSKKKQ